MIRNFFRIAIRNIFKHKVFSFINVFGLALGVAVCLLISAYIYDELHYDRSAANASQIYRVELNVAANGEIETYPLVDVAVGAGMQAAYPEIEASTRILRQNETFVKYNNDLFKEKKIAAVDSNFLSFFSIPLIEGNIATALNEPQSVVITTATAKKYFGTRDALGQTLLFGSNPIKVTGVMDELPATSHFHFDMYLSMSDRQFPQQTWSNINFYTYLRLNKHADPRHLEAQFPDLVAKYVVPETARDMGVSIAEARKTVNSFRFILQPLTGIHLHSNTKYEIEANGDIKYIYIFGIMAIFVLLLAGINFTNLSTASSEKRAREVGIRKVLGSQKKQLVSQFLMESIMMSYLAVALALLITYFFLPYLNQLSGKHISFAFFFSPVAILLWLLFGLILGIVAGLYPAFVISSFNISRVFRTYSNTSTGGRGPLRSALVVFQFVVSTGLIIATLVVSKQLHYMQDMKLGYDKDQLVYLQDAQQLGDAKAQNTFRQSLLADNRIVSASIGNGVPGGLAMDGTQAYAKEKSSAESKDEIHINIYHVDYDYVPTLGIPIVKGRNFSRDFPTDSFAAIINEAAVRDLGWSDTDPIGKTVIASGQRYFKVIGVAKDFHYASVKQKIAPLMLTFGTGFRTGVIIKFKAPEARNIIASIQQKWKTFNAGAPFEFYFLDEKFANLYKSEENTGHLITAFAVLSILIASLGLFGLATYVTQQRRRELGVRKVFGASSKQLVLLVSRDFLLLVLIAFVIVVPVSWWAMHQWLQYFAYRTSISWWVFLVAGVAAFLLALITVSFQAIKAATTNPVKTLRAD